MESTDRMPRRRGPGSGARRLAAAALMLGLTLVSAACGGEPTENGSGVDPDAFVDIMVALREAERATVTSDSAEAEFAERKRQVLAEHGIEEEDLRQFVRRHHDDFALMSRLWDSVTQRLKHVPERLLEEEQAPGEGEPAENDTLPREDALPAVEGSDRPAVRPRSEDLIRVRTLH